MNKTLKKQNHASQIFTAFVKKFMQDVLNIIRSKKKYYVKLYRICTNLYGQT